MMCRIGVMIVCVVVITVYASGFAFGAGGSIVVWGSNSYNQCNIPSSNRDFVAVAGGHKHSLGLKSDGSITAWGWNDSGECNVPSPNTGFVAVSAGYSHSLGLKSDGSIVAWGWNDYGQCNVPSPNSSFVAVAAGAAYSLGLKSDGSIVAWGNNDYGQCNVPSPNTGFVAVSAGHGHSLGLKSNGSIVVWGYNLNGECNVPSPNSGFLAVSAGWWHSLAIRGSDANPTTVRLTLAPTAVKIGDPLTITAYAPGATAVRLHCDGIAIGFPEFSMTRSDSSTFTLSFPTSFLNTALGSTVEFTASGIYPGGAITTGSATLRIRDIIPPPAPQGDIVLDNNNTTYGLAESSYDLITQQSDRLEARLKMTHDLNMWFSASCSANGGATCSKSIGSVAELLGSAGFVNPEGTVAFKGVFTDAGQSATIRLAFDEDAGVIQITDIVMKLLGTGGVDVTLLADALPDLKKIGLLYDAARQFKPFPKTFWDWKNACGRSANIIRKFATDEQQLDALLAILKHLGVQTTKKDAQKLLKVLDIYDILKIISSEITYAVQTKGNDLTSTFTSKRTSTGTLAAVEAPSAATTVYRIATTADPADSAALSVDTSVTASAQDWLINYNVTNSGTSPVWSWTVYYNKASGYPTQVTSPPGWTYRLDYEQGAITWITEASAEGWITGSFGPNTIPAGGSLSGFSISHTAPPGYTLCSSIDANYASSLNQTLAPGAVGSVSETKLRLDSLPKVISDRVVSTVLPDRFYVVDQNRISGICVTGASTTVVEGDIVRITGSNTEVDGEAAIQASCVIVTGHTTQPAPMMMAVSALGGSSFGVQSSVSSGIGVNNIGLLVRVCGRVIDVDPSDTPSWIVIGDGPVCLNSVSMLVEPVQVRVQLAHETTVPPKGSFIAVTGASSCYQDGESLRRQVLAKSAVDILHL